MSARLPAGAPGARAAALALAVLALAAAGSVAGAGRPAGTLRPAQTAGLNVTLQLGGSANAVVVVGNRAYAAVGQRLYIFNANNPASPEVLGLSQVLPGLIQDITVNGPTAYLALGLHGLVMMDVSNPANPVVSGFLGGTTAQVVVDGPRLYIVAGTAGVRIVETANPANQLGTFDDYVTHLAVSGDLAFVVSRNLVMWDVANPAVPRKLRDLADWADAVATDGNIVWGATSEEAGGGTRNGFVQTWDVSNVRFPAPLGKVPTAAQPRFGRIEGRQFLVLSDAKLERFNVDSPVSIPKIGSVAVPLEAQQASLDADYALFAAGELGFRTTRLDSSGPSEGSRILDLPGRPESIALDGDRLYVEDAERRILIYGASNVAAGPIGQFPASAESGAMVAQDGLMYLGTSDRRLRILDVRDPAAVRQLSELSLPKIPARLAVGGGYAYLATDPELRVVDVRDPARPSTIAVTQPDGGVTDLALGGRWLYVTGPNMGPVRTASLKVIDVNYPTTPRVRSMIEAAASTQGVATLDQLVYINGLQVVDACNPDRPVQLARLDTPGGRTRNLAVDGWRVYVAKTGLGGGGGKLLLYDDHVPALPVLAGTVDAGDAVDGVVAAQGHFWASARDAGLIVGTSPEIYRPTPTFDPRPTATRSPSLNMFSYLPYSSSGPVGRPCTFR